VDSFPLECFLASIWNSFTTSFKILWVSTLREICGAPGINSSHNFAHSGFSIHESGKPAAAVKHNTRLSKLFFRSAVQARNSAAGINGFVDPRRLRLRPLTIMLLEQEFGRELDIIMTEAESDGPILPRDDVGPMDSALMLEADEKGEMERKWGGYG